MNIYDLLYEPIKLKRPIRMFEAFSGVGTQYMALKRITKDIELVGFSEIDEPAIRSYHVIHGNDIKNYGDITKMNEIPSCDIFTWSFPCTDISKAGHRKGMTKETRSGLVYDVLRLLESPYNKPKVLIMENVPDLIQETFHRQFREIRLELEHMGYINYVETLNAKHYGVAQNRNRVFMVSILGDYSYTFPKHVKLQKRLKDYLEDEVDEKYYLSQKKLEQISNWKSYQNPLDNILKDDSTCPTITTRVAETDAGGISASMIVYGEPVINHAIASREYKNSNWQNISPTLLARDYNDPKIVGIHIVEDTKKGYSVALDGDGVYINRPEQKRGVVQKCMIPTIKTSGDDIGVVLLGENIVKYPNRGVYEIEGTHYWIRKLTPRECWRLMGISDVDFDKAQAVNSNSQLYKQAGNAIVVDVFEAVLREMIET